MKFNKATKGSMRKEFNMYPTERAIKEFYEQYDRLQLDTGDAVKAAMHFLKISKADAERLYEEYKHATV